MRVGDLSNVSIRVFRTIDYKLLFGNDPVSPILYQSMVPGVKRGVKGTSTVGWFEDNVGYVEMTAYDPDIDILKNTLTEDKNVPAIPTLHDLFPFEYVGGGYFRKRGVKVGVAAEILHGEQAVAYLYNKMKEIA